MPREPYDGLGDAFEPENFMPSQWNDLFKPRVSTPEQKLMAGVLDQAVRDYVINSKIREGGNIDWTKGAAKSERRWRTEVRLWVDGKEGNSLHIPFKMICEAFDKDVEYCRKRLLATLDRIDTLTVNLTTGQKASSVIIPRRSPTVRTGKLAGTGKATEIQYQWSAGGHGNRHTVRSHKRKVVLFDEEKTNEENVE